MRPKVPKIEFDMLQMYFDEPYVIDLPDAIGSITVYSPMFGDIIKLGEKRFYSTLDIFITNTTSYRLPLWEKGMDWNEMSDFDLFCLLIGGIEKEASSLLFGDIDFSTFFYNPEYKILYSQVHEVEINEEVYNHFSQYLRTMFNNFPEDKITDDNILKQWYINKDKRKRQREEKNPKDWESSLQPLVSACVNHPGFKYKKSELKEVGVGEFFDSVKRLQIYEQSTALLKGMYSGFVDGKNIKPEDYNFMKKL